MRMHGDDGKGERGERKSSSIIMEFLLFIYFSNPTRKYKRNRNENETRERNSQTRIA